MLYVSSATYLKRKRGSRFRNMKSKQSEVVMKRYGIERDIPGVGSLNDQQLKGAAANPTRRWPS